MGIEFAQQKVNKGNVVMNLNLYDTAGQEKYESMAALFFRHAIGALLVFDITDLDSFENLPN